MESLIIFEYNNKNMDTSDIKQLNTNEFIKAREHNLVVVGIGASAGGLDAFKKIVQAIAENSGMAYVLVQHLSPDHPSNLPEILRPLSKIPVHEIINDIILEANHIYIIPENNTLTVCDGTLKLEIRSRNQKKNAAIDIFFESLAEVYKTYAIGVVLSGTAYDGTYGLKKIKEQGGATIAQDPESATFKSMPQSAIDAGAADYIIIPEKIPAQLVQIHASYCINHGYSDEERISKNEQDTLQQILNVIFVRTGNDFHHYKQVTIRRRIARRMVILGRETLQDYFHHLRNDKSEQDLLFNDFLIPVTYFFRDQDFFEALTTSVFPQLVQNAVKNNLRIWIAGCATGEEAYSIAIAIHEYLLSTNNIDLKVQIFASDISEKSIAKARAAIYGWQDIEQISESRLHTYFTKRDGQFYVNKIIRDMCVFAVHNFIKDAPFAKIDLLSCRNVLIYLDSYLQSKALVSFHYSIKEKGFLLLGKSETASNMQNLYQPISKVDKIYQRKFTSGRFIPNALQNAETQARKSSFLTENKSPTESDFQKLASDVLFSKYMPVGVIINENLEIVHFHGDTSAFLLPSPGKPNFSILKMAREGICFELRNALTDMKVHHKPIHKNNIVVKNQPYLATFDIVPLENEGNNAMVLFFKNDYPENDADRNSDQCITDQRIYDLEKELDQLREDIKRVTDEQQTAYEELQTSNEELLSSGEELQAVNEELETSTEELQSNNEELMCVNDELLNRQNQLIALQNYSESIIKTIREPLLVLDTEFVVKSANPSFYKYFNTTEIETEGHSFFEIGDCQWDIAEFKDLLREMLDTKSFIEDLKVATHCPGIGKKIMMINAHRIVDANPVGLILLVIEDVTDLVSANDLLIEKNNELKRYNDQLENFSAAASHDLQEPLRKIHMFCNRIQDTDEGLSDSSKHDLERMKFSLIHMKQLITDLIGYSRITFVEKEFKKTDLNVVLKKTVLNLKEEIAEKGAKINIEKLPTLKAIPYQLQQLFSNLIINAVKYSREGIVPEIRIVASELSEDEIKAISGNPDTNYVKINVSDNGIGFDKEFEHRVFEPFYRLHSHDVYRGSGLGLTLVKKIAINHKGFVQANSIINKGTIFSIILPMPEN